MKPVHLILISLLTAASTAALANDGSDRSRQFLAEFRQQQQQIHGTKAVAQASTPDAEKTSKDSI